MSYKPHLAPPLSLVELPSVGSTNDHAKQLARNGYPGGVIVWAHEQTEGRGRQGNVWVSTPGNLFMSMILRPAANASQTGQLALLAGAALANVLEPISPLSEKIKLKWPNDLLINGKKAAGILVETESQGLRQVPWIVVGIGVNIVSAPEGAISLYDIGVKDYDAGKILELLAKEMQALFTQWEGDGGFDDIRDAWMKRAYKRGEKVSARLPKETVTGTFEGIDRTGALLLTLEDGSRRMVSSGEVFTEV